MTHIDNESFGYQQLVDEIVKEQEHLRKRVTYLMTGILACKEFSDQEYEVFIQRSLKQKSFKDISITLSISESTARVYYHRATKKLNKQAIIVQSQFIRK